MAETTISGPDKPTRQATPIPGIGEFHLPLSRNDLMLLLVAFNMGAIGFETYLAHLISGNVKPAEAIPVVFGPIAAAVMLLALYLRVRHQQETAATLVIMGVAAASITVGVLGSAFHWSRVLAPETIEGSRLRWDWLIYAPPAIAPLAFAGIGLMGIISAMVDTKPESGKLTLPGVVSFQTPLTQTSQLLYLVGLGILAATLSAFLDHGRVNFEDEFTLIPVVLGLFGGVVTLMLAMTEKRTRSDFFIFFWTMLLMIWVGVMGLGLHINADLSETGEQIVWERFIRGAPVMAPMLFANMGLLGLITMVGAEVQPPKSDQA